MPFTYRDKPKLAERLRGKSGEEILNELKSDFDPERKMFFGSPSWRTRHNNNNSGFSRGFPFDDDSNRANIRTYLDDIASRHPEFADQLREPPWGENFVNPTFGRKRRGSNSGIEEDISSEASASTQVPNEVKEPRQNLTNFGLRNTVPLGPGANVEEERRLRSMSAPPDNRASDKSQRFVTKCEIPIMNDPKQDTSAPKPDLSGRGGHEQPQQKANNAPNVRVIPIQVEGRDTPIVNTNIDTSTNFAGETFGDSSFEGRLPRDFGTYQRHSPRFAHKERAPTPPQYQYAPQYQQYVPPHQHFMPQQFVPTQQQQQPPPHAFGHPQQSHPFAQQQQQQPHPFAQQQQQPHGFAPQQQQPQAFAHQPQHSQKPPAPPPPQQQQQQEPPQNSKFPQGDETDAKRPPQPKQEPIKDPIEKVQVIQKEVEELMKQVESFNGNSRSDKQYLMLDELLTRQLLLLDNIDTEGKENVRQARKDTIQSIQRCISTLENKVPLPENSETTTEPKQNENVNEAKAEDSSVPQAMEVDQTKENTPVENKESQKMELDNKESKETQQQQVEGNKEKV